MKNQPRIWLMVACLMLLAGVAAAWLGLRYDSSTEQDRPRYSGHEQTRFAVWNRLMLTSRAARIGECFDEIHLHFTAHPETGWQRDGSSMVRFYSGQCPGGGQPAKPTFQSGIWEGRKSLSPVSPAFWGSAQMEASQLPWEPAWGHPEEVLFQFCEDRSVERWTAEAFREWIGERQSP